MAWEHQWPRERKPFCISEGKLGFVGVGVGLERLLEVVNQGLIWWDVLVTTVLPVSNQE